MARWRARIEFDAAMSDKQANQAARRMALHAGTVIPDEARRRVEVVLDTEAGTLRQAVTLALRTARAALAEADVAGAPLAVHATTLAGRQVDVSQPLRTELISPAEIGKILGVPKAKLREITMRPDFPPPVVRIRGGAIYARSAVDAFHAGWDGRYGPPSRTHAHVATELAHIPKGKPRTLQQELRLRYNYERSTDLSGNPQSSPSDTLARVIEMIWEHHPDFKPDYDRAFFHPHPSRRRAALRLVTTAD